MPSQAAYYYVYLVAYKISKWMASLERHSQLRKRSMEWSLRKRSMEWSLRQRSIDVTTPLER